MGRTYGWIEPKAPWRNSTGSPQHPASTIKHLIRKRHAVHAYESVRISTRGGDSNTAAYEVCEVTINGHFCTCVAWLRRILRTASFGTISDASGVVPTRATSMWPPHADKLVTREYPPNSGTESMFGAHKDGTGAEIATWSSWSRAHRVTCKCCPRSHVPICTLVGPQRIDCAPGSGQI
jgi:hypothetical protein